MVNFDGFMEDRLNGGYGHELDRLLDSVEPHEDDGQPSEYDEWQDYYGGDDWDQGQYDGCCDWQGVTRKSSPSRQHSSPDYSTPAHNTTPLPFSKVKA